MDAIVAERCQTAVDVACQWDAMGLDLEQAVEWCEEADTHICATGTEVQIRKWDALHNHLMALLAASLGMTSLVPSPTLRRGKPVRPVPRQPTPQPPRRRGKGAGDDA